MLWLLLPLAAACAAAPSIPHGMTNGFTHPSISLSSGKQAVCVSGLISLTVSANQTKLLYPEPVDEFALTETLVELLQTNPTIFATTNGGPAVVTGTYKIFSKLCFPTNPALLSDLQTVQFLTHGATLDSNYWDLGPNNSYIDAAAAAGYATFSYDQIGVGKSDHPDPIQVVQGPYQVEVAHTLITALRKASIGGYSFTHLVGVGHSAGAAISQGITSKYPKDFDGVILTGTSASFGYVGTSVAAFSSIIANQDPSGRFAGICNAYFTQANSQSIQFPFYRYPYYDPAILAAQVAGKQTNTIGNLLTLGGIISVSTAFTGPVDVVLGQQDLVFCGGDCTYPSDQSAVVQPVFYPAANVAGSQHYLVPNSGHVIAAHYSAPLAFNHMIGFCKANGL